MKKIPTLYVRDWDGDPRYVTREVNPECAWVFAGEGKPTRKYDGTCMMLDADGSWWARREVKPGKPMPPAFWSLVTDAETGKTIGWEPIERSGFAKWHAEALANAEREAALAEEDAALFEPGTYELVGPKINGNPEGEDQHELIAHEHAEEVFVHLGDFEIMREQILALKTGYGAEGVVWHHPDGRMAKIKARDFPQAAR